MNRINWGRLILGGLVASIILFLTDGFLHEKVVMADWLAVYRGLGLAEPHHEGARFFSSPSLNSAAASSQSTSTRSCDRVADRGRRQRSWQASSPGSHSQSLARRNSFRWDFIHTRCG
jgi:hypothetical protein